MQPGYHLILNLLSKWRYIHTELQIWYFTGLWGRLLLAHQKWDYPAWTSAPRGCWRGGVHGESHHQFVIQWQFYLQVRHTVRSSRIFDSDPADFVPSTGMQKSCTASSIADLGEQKHFFHRKDFWGILLSLVVTSWLIAQLLTIVSKN